MTLSEFTTVLSVLFVFVATAGFIMTFGTALGDCLDQHNSHPD
jgi:hypothetical protein